MDAIRSRYRVLDRIRQDPDRPLRLLTSVSTGAQLAGEQALVRRERKEGRRQVGDTEVIEIKVESVSPATRSGESATVVVDACWDVAKVDVLDAAGRSVITPERPDRGWTRFTVTEVRASAASDGDGASEWLVATGRDLEREPCSGE